MLRVPHSSGETQGEYTSIFNRLKPLLRGSRGQHPDSRATRSAPRACRCSLHPQPSLHPERYTLNRTPLTLSTPSGHPTRGCITIRQECKGTARWTSTPFGREFLCTPLLLLYYLRVES